MADNKTARRFAILAIPLLVEQGCFKQWEDLNQRTAIVSIVERILYELALQDPDLEIEETEEEIQLHGKKIYDFNCLKLAIEDDNFKPNMVSLKSLYDKIKLEVINAGNDIERNGVDEVVGNTKKGSTRGTPAKRVTHALSVNNVQGLR